MDTNGLSFLSPMSCHVKFAGTGSTPRVSRTKVKFKNSQIEEK